MHTMLITPSKRSRRVLAIAALTAAASGGAVATGAQAYPGGTFAQPDLVISTIESGSLPGVTVKNAGLRASGQSRLHVSGVGTFYVPPLEAGASYRVATNNPCRGNFTATADAWKQVVESNEANNSSSVGPVIC